MINQIIKYVLVTSCLSSLLLYGFTHNLDAFSLMIGSGWGSLSLFFLSKLIKALLVTKNPLKFALHMFLKFPLLYGIGYLILRTEIGNLQFMVTGLSMSLLGVVVGPLVKLARGTL